jgi:hypothetical protein
MLPIKYRISGKRIVAEDPEMEKKLLLWTE